MSLTVLTGDCLEQLATIPDQSFHCCVTSPPYWGLRDYGVAGQIGLEKTPQEYVAKMVAVFAEVRRVLRNDGTLWLNLGDTYANDGKWGGEAGGKQFYLGPENRKKVGREKRFTGLKAKDLVGIPWRVAFALQADGWYLRSDIIWHKPNPMPESVTDRPTKSHEYIFLLSKSAKYYYDAEAIKEPVSETACGNRKEFRGGGSYTGGNSFDNSAYKPNRTPGNTKRLDKEGPNSRMHVSHDPAHDHEYNGKHRKELEQSAGRRILKNVAAARAKGGSHDSPFGNTRNKRSVWTVATAPYSEAHFATFPPDLIKPCILAGSPTAGTILDPFAGSGTTAQVAIELSRSATLIELNPAYVKLIGQRTDVTPGLPL